MLLALLLAACGGGGGTGFDLGQVVAGEPAGSGLQLPGPAVPGEAEADGERRQVVSLPAGTWSWQGVVPPRALFAAGALAVPRSEGASPALEVRAELATGELREVLDLGRGTGWVDLRADLAPYAGRRVRLEVTARRSDGGGGLVAWSEASIRGLPEVAPSRPNVLLIVVDTLRADHLGTYGYGRDTDPHLSRALSERGVRVETAYSQAPWTVPSVASFLTSRYPGEILHGPLETYAIPAAVPTLAERLAAAGYRTAAFFGNFVLRDANGFGRGFANRYTPPAVPESNLLHADSVNRRALPWLAAHQHEPFFLYVHYMDPHDPYDNPEVVDGRSPFFPEYAGSLSGQWVHGVYTGGIALGDVEQDVKHLAALYDTEIHYVDRAIGELLDRLDPVVAANTLIVLTSDHGEELYDHGGWKHGQTLYQEQIHVPLLLRWDGHLPAGRSLAGTVRLVDLVPTVLEAVGAPPCAECQGESLLAALRGDAPLPRHPAFAQHLASGPLRAAVVAEGKKLMVFNREEPFHAGNALIDHLWRLDVGRMARSELYDLGGDPAEKHNLAAERPELVRALAPALGEHLDRVLPGLRLAVSGLPAGRRLSGRIRFDLAASAGPPALTPLFLSPEDRIDLAGDTLRFELVGEPVGAAPLEKGALLVGEHLAIRELVLDPAPAGGPIPSVRLGAGTAYRGGPIEPADLLTSGRPSVGDGPLLRLWVRQGQATAEVAGVDAEVEKSLRALGYIQ